MSLTINANLESLTAQRAASANDALLAVSMQRLSSGLRVNSAADDAAGLAIGARMDSQVRGGDTAVRNLNDGISLLQTADTALASMSELFQRMRELAIQALNVQSNLGDVVNLESEYSELYNELSRIKSGAAFNGAAVLQASTRTFQVGPNVADTISMSLSGPPIAVLPPSPLTGFFTATNVVDSVDKTLRLLNSKRATVGALLNRFSNAIQSMQSGGEAQAAARSRVMDADYASETAQLSRSLILQKVGIAMVTQANQRTRTVMSLLRG